MSRFNHIVKAVRQCKPCLELAAKERGNCKNTYLVILEVVTKESCLAMTVYDQRIDQKCD